MNRKKKGCAVWDSSNWWKIPSVDFMDLFFAFAGFGRIGGPAGHLHINMDIGKNEMTILRDCGEIIKKAFASSRTDRTNKARFLSYLGPEGRKYVLSITRGKKQNGYPTG